nr:anti-sigma factor [Ornithinimicrobium cryptoxanthini]
MAAAYALDAVDDAERAAFEAHLEGCPDCQREVAELTETALALSDGLDVEPAPALREQLLAQVAVTPQDAPTSRDAVTSRDAPTSQDAIAPQDAVTSQDAIAPQDAVTSQDGRPDELADRRAARHRAPGRFSRWVLAGAAAAAVAVGAIAVTQWPDDASDPSIVAVQEVLDAPDAVRASGSVDGATVTVVTAYSIDRSVVVTEGLADAPEGQDYQLWFVGGDGAAVSAGLLPRDDDQFLLEGDPGEAVAVGITLEPAGGSEQPTSDPLVAVPLEG